MAMALRPATRDQVVSAELALIKLREARDLLKHAGCPQTTERVRLAIASAGGAVRHAKARSDRK